MKKFTVSFFSVIIIVWALDFATKQWALANLVNTGYVPVLGSLLGWELTYNTGGVFGIFQGNAMVFQVLTGLAIIFLLIFYARGVSQEENTRLFQLAMSFILGGALGNFTDRFYQKGVIDFINMGIGPYRWPTYNVADAFISTGAILLLISFILFEKKQKNKVSETQHCITLPANQRLDYALAQALSPQLSRSRIQKLIEEGMVTVNGVRETKPSFKTSEPATVILHLPPEPANQLTPALGIKLTIVYEDPYLAVIHKPAGLTVHPGIGTGKDTLVHALLAHFSNLPQNFGSDRPGIVHRLDRDTQGLLLIAKTAQSHHYLSELFQKRKIKKTYHALLWGNPGVGRRLAGYIQRHPKERRLMQFTIHKTSRAREASLSFKPLASKKDLTLVEINLETGRTHQIRATFAALGCPIVGDMLYSNPSKLYRRFKVGKKRRMAIENLKLCLLASGLEFPHPLNAQQMQFHLPIPAEWLQLMSLS